MIRNQHQLQLADEWSGSWDKTLGLTTSLNPISHPTPIIVPTHYPAKLVTIVEQIDFPSSETWNLRRQEQLMHHTILVLTETEKRQNTYTCFLTSTVAKLQMCFASNVVVPTSHGCLNPWLGMNGSMQNCRTCPHSNLSRNYGFRVGFPFFSV